MGSLPPVLGPAQLTPPRLPPPPSAIPQGLEHPLISPPPPPAPPRPLPCPLETKPGSAHAGTEVGPGPAETVAIGVILPRGGKLDFKVPSEPSVGNLKLFPAFSPRKRILRGPHGSDQGQVRVCLSCLQAGRSWQGLVCEFQGAQHTGPGPPERKKPGPECRRRQPQALPRRQTGY